MNENIENIAKLQKYFAQRGKNIKSIEFYENKIQNTNSDNSFLLEKKDRIYFYCKSYIKSKLASAEIVILKYTNSIPPNNLNHTIIGDGDLQSDFLPYLLFDSIENFTTIDPLTTTEEIEIVLDGYIVEINE